MGSRKLVSALVIVIGVLGVGVALLLYTIRANSHVSDCNEMADWISTRTLLSNRAFDTLYSESLSRTERRERALGHVDALVEWEMESSVPEIGRDLRSAATVNDQAWLTSLQNALGGSLPTPSGEEMFGAMQAETAALDELKETCGWDELIEQTERAT